jgi:nucleotide-binding universal stress UspA family protein
MHTIVIGYDGSESAGRALERTAELVDNGAEVVLVSAIHPLVGKGGMPFDPLEKEDHDRHLRTAEARLAELGVKVRTVEGVGDPARLIADQAKEVDADLIVVGNEHKNLLERLIMGSVGSGVAHRAECDVLVVR